MAKTPHKRWRWRPGRWIVVRLSSGASITVGKPDRQLRIGRRSLTIRLDWPGLGLAISWRRSWPRLWNDVLRRRHGA